MAIRLLFTKTTKLMLILAVGFSLGCAKKKSNLRNQPQATSATRTGTGANATTGTVIDQNAKRLADSLASKNGITIDWVGTDKPYEGKTEDNVPFFMVVNVFKVNGQSYEFPTVHYHENSIPINSQVMYYTINGVDMDLEAQCYDQYCNEYLLSYKISKESQNIQQIMLYVNFDNNLNPIISVNDANHFMSLSQFADILKNLSN